MIITINQLFFVLLLMPLSLWNMEPNTYFIDFGLSAKCYSESGKFTGCEPFFGGTKPDKYICNFNYALLKACIEGNIDIMTSLLEWNPCVISMSYQDNNGLIDTINALHIAAACGKTVIVELLIKRIGMSINAVDGRLMTPLHHALAHQHVETARFLLSHGARSFDKDKYGNRVYDYAFITGDKVLIKQIGEEMCDEDGHNLLHYAVIDQDYELAVNLLRQGVSDIKDKYGYPALYYAREKKDQKMVAILQPLSIVSSTEPAF